MRPLHKFIDLLKSPFLANFFSPFLVYSTQSMSRNGDQNYTKMINFSRSSNLVQWSQNDKEYPNSMDMRPYRRGSSGGQAPR